MLLRVSRARVGSHGGGWVRLGGFERVATSRKHP